MSENELVNVSDAATSSLPQVFPEELKEELIGSRWSCQLCEGRFEVKLTKPNGTKSKTWVMAPAIFGRKWIALLLVKCPNCSQPVHSVIISKVESFEETEKRAAEAQKKK